MGGRCCACSKQGDVSTPDRARTKEPDFDADVIVPIPRSNTTGSHGVRSGKAVSSTTTQVAIATPSTEEGEPLAGSLNLILQYLWPRISNYVTELLTTDVQKQLEESLPSALAGLAFEGERCHLGKKPFKFTAVRIERETQVTSVGAHQNLIFDASFSWAADCCIFLKFRGASLGIEGLTLSGNLLIELISLTNVPPFFEGVRIYFNDIPEVDVNFGGTGMGLLNLAVVRNKIISLVQSNVKDICVVPNRLGYTVMPESDIFKIKCPPSQGILDVTVWGATDLPIKDESMQSIVNSGWRKFIGSREPAKKSGTSDPYVLVRCGAFEYRSKTCYKNLSPQFCWSMSLLIAEVAQQMVAFKVFDEDLFSGDDYIGSVVIPAEAMISWGSAAKLEFELRNEEKEQCGKICLSAEWRPLMLSTSDDALTRASEGSVTVGVFHVAQLPKFEAGTLYWVTIACAGVKDGFSEVSAESSQIDPDLVPMPVETDHPANLNTEKFRSRVKILQNYQMSNAEMANVLQVDVNKFASYLSRGSSADLGDLEEDPLVDQIVFEHGAEFPVKNVGSAKVTIDVMCQRPSRQPVKLGTYSTGVTHLTASSNFTQIETVEVPDAQIMIRMKLGLRFVM